MININLLKKYKNKVWLNLNSNCVNFEEGGKTLVSAPF